MPLRPYRVKVVNPHPCEGPRAKKRWEESKRALEEKVIKRKREAGRPKKGSERRSKEGQEEENKMEQEERQITDLLTESVIEADVQNLLSGQGVSSSLLKGSFSELGLFGEMPEDEWPSIMNALDDGDSHHWGAIGEKDATRQPIACTTTTMDLGRATQLDEKEVELWGLKEEDASSQSGTGTDDCDADYDDAC